MPNFTPATADQLNPKSKRILLESDEKFQRLVKGEDKKHKYEHHYRVVQCSIIVKGDYIQILVLYNGFGKPLASMKKTWDFRIDEDTLEKEKIWDYVTDLRAMRVIALEYYFRRIKKRSKDGFMFD